PGQYRFPAILQVHSMGKASVRPYYSRGPRLHRYITRAGSLPEWRRHGSSELERQSSIFQGHVAPGLILGGRRPPNTRAADPSGVCEGAVSVELSSAVVRRPVREGTKTYPQSVKRCACRRPIASQL